MPAQQKVLWVVNYNRMEDFLAQARSVGATAVAIRTDNDIAKAIHPFQDAKIKVYGWRWPSAMRDAALKEADKVVGLLAKGLDGYFVDPEGAPGKPYDWDRPGLDELADEFCSTITAAAPDKLFGTTSHYRGSKVFPHLPWSTFFKFAGVLLPQSYWRSSEGTIGHGIPADNYRAGLQFWTQTGGDRAKIVPMAGELAQVSGDEIAEYAAEGTKQAITALHFYTYDDTVGDDVWAAIRRA